MHGWIEAYGVARSPRFSLILKSAPKDLFFHLPKSSFADLSDLVADHAQRLHLERAKAFVFQHLQARRHDVHVRNLFVGKIRQSCERNADAADVLKALVRHDGIGFARAHRAETARTDHLAQTGCDLKKDIAQQERAHLKRKIKVQ